MTFAPDKSLVRRLLILVIIGVTIWSYVPVFTNGFLNYDDPGYVTRNEHVLSGLCGSTLAWAFTSTEQSNWHPLTWLSHALDITLFGVNPGWHHAMSLLIHIMTAVMLFLLFEKLAGSVWPAAVIAGVFALHPLHVESVAWLAERKDVLSGFFWILALWYYTAYRTSVSRKTYVLSVLAFILGLLAKPMLVSLPFILIVLDYWPFGVMNLRGGWVRNRERTISAGGLVLEKLPFFILAIGSSVVTFMVQHAGGSMAGEAKLSVAERLLNAAISYFRYIWKSIIPADLAVFYPHPETTVVIWQGVAAAIGLIAISWFVWHHRGKRPWLLAGWCWYVITLLPVIGIVQVGIQALADRYMYLPMTGLMIMIVWTVDSILKERSGLRPPVIAIALIALVLFALGTRSYAAAWKDSITLMTHAVGSTENNHVAEMNLGMALADSGRYAEAVAHLADAVRARPEETLIRSNYALTLSALGRHREALEQYLWLKSRVQPDPRLYSHIADAQTALRMTTDAAGTYREVLNIDSTDIPTLTKLAILLADQGLYTEAREYCSKALRIEPRNVRIHDLLGVIAGKAGDGREAEKQFREAISIDSTFSNAWNDLGILYERGGDTLRALDAYSGALRHDSLNWQLHLKSGIICARLKQFDEAEMHWRRVTNIQPGMPDAWLDLGRLMAMKGRLDESAQAFDAAMRLRPNNPAIMSDYGQVCERMGNTDRARSLYMMAAKASPGYPAAQQGLARLGTGGK